jgi:hypothetical protein
LAFSVFDWRVMATDWSNLEMLIERRARAQERVVPETIARFLREAAGAEGLDEVGAGSDTASGRGDRPGGGGAGLRMSP